MVCLDLDTGEIKTLNEGNLPIYKPSLLEMVRRNMAANRLVFTANEKDAVLHSTLQFIAVGKPPDEDGSVDMQHVRQPHATLGVT